MENINFNDIDKIIKNNWKEFRFIKFDKYTKEFIINFCSKYHELIENNLLDSSINFSKRKDMLRRLLVLFSNSNCILYNDINNSILEEKEITKLINDVFKLEHCLRNQDNLN